MSKISDLFEGILPTLVEASKKAVIRNERFGDESAISIFLAAYNTMQEEEFNGDFYIFNLHDKNDLKYLVDHEILNACQIADIYPKCTASGLFRFLEDGSYEVVSLEKVKEIICNNMEALMRCVLMYHNGSTYSKVYDMIISSNLLETDFSTLR
jgi:hypothetical protein